MAAAKSGVDDTSPSIQSGEIKLPREAALYNSPFSGPSGLTQSSSPTTLPLLVSCDWILGYLAAGRGSGCIFPLYLAAS